MNHRAFGIGLHELDCDLDNSGVDEVDQERVEEEGIVQGFVWAKHVN